MCKKCSVHYTCETNQLANASTGYLFYEDVLPSFGNGQEIFNLRVVKIQVANTGEAGRYTKEDKQTGHEKEISMS